MDTLIINQQNEVNYSKAFKKIITDVANTAARILKLPEIGRASCRERV